MKDTKKPEENSVGYQLFDSGTAAEEFIHETLKKFPRPEFGTQIEVTYLPKPDGTHEWVVQWMIRSKQ